MVNFKFKENASDEEFMPDLLGAEYAREKRLGPILLMASLISVAVLVIWAAVAEIDEIARGEGKIIPSSRVQLISHLEGGIMKKILIREGDIVKPGQVMFTLDNTIAEARASEGKSNYYRYLATVARLRAQIDGTPFVVPEEVVKNAPLEAEDAQHLYKTRVDSLKNEIRIGEEEIEQKKQEFNELKSKETELVAQTELNARKIEILEPLVKRNIEPEISLLDLKKETSQLRGELNGIKSVILKAQSALEQAQERVTQIQNKAKTDDYNELRDANNRLSSAQGSVTSEGDRLTRTEVRSPVRGIVKQLMINTVGGIVKPGEEIAEVVPLEDKLLVEAQIRPQDVAFLKPGLSASVKITAYDFSTFGDLKAELVRISADTIKDEKGNTFYKAYLRTKGNRLSKAKKDHPIIPGMVATVDILTGKKTVLAYIMKPILKAKTMAMTER